MSVIKFENIKTDQKRPYHFAPEHKAVKQTYKMPESQIKDTVSFGVNKKIIQKLKDGIKKRPYNLGEESIKNVREGLSKLPQDTSKKNIEFDTGRTAPTSAPISSGEAATLKKTPSFIPPDESYEASYQHTPRFIEYDEINGLLTPIVVGKHEIPEHEPIQPFVGEEKPQPTLISATSLLEQSGKPISYKKAPTDAELNELITEHFPPKHDPFEEGINHNVASDTLTPPKYTNPAAKKDGERELESWETAYLSDFTKDDF
jgi:hypothetical protein